MHGSDLKRIRKANKRSQADFADLVGVGRQAVSDWERGINDIPEAVEIIAAAIDERPELLIWFEQIRGLR